MSELWEVWPCPGPPGWEIDWGAVDAAHPWLAGLEGCPQNREYHTEGDVYVHTRLVAEALVDDPAWRALPLARRRLLFLAALLHDLGKGGFAPLRNPPRARGLRSAPLSLEHVGKPLVTRTEEDGHVSARGHDRRGAREARLLLWRLGLPVVEREQLCALVDHHLQPFFLLEQEDPRRTVHAHSLRVRVRELALLARADLRGRTCPGGVADRLEQVDVYEALAEEEGCLDQPYTGFPNPNARVAYFRSRTRPPDASCDPAPSPRLTLMSGLPGAGKDHWLDQHRPGLARIELDALRDELGIDPARDPQGRVVQRARELAREHLRAGRDFAWSATNLSRRLRDATVQLALDYGAEVELVHVEADPDTLLERNRERRRSVPEPVIERLLGRWEVPDAREAHQVSWVDGAGQRAAGP